MAIVLVMDDPVDQEAAAVSDSAAVQRMIDEGSPVSPVEPGADSRCATCGGPKSERAEPL